MPASAEPIIALHWFRADLRLADNPALAASAAAERCLFVFIDETDADLRQRGGAARWWLHHSLGALSAEIARRGGDLAMFRGRARDLVPAIAQAIGARRVSWTRRYGASERALDAEIKADLRAKGIECVSANGALIYEPMEIVSQSGGPFRVFTPFWRACQTTRPPQAPIPAPARLPAAPLGAAAVLGRISLAELGLLPRKPDWSGGLAAAWRPGEAGASARLAAFLDTGLAGYAENRDRPDLPSTSRLSPHLAFGEISPRQIWQAAELAQAAGGRAASARDLAKFEAELGWREFSYHLLYHFPALARQNLQPRFDAFPWLSNAAALKAWQRGLSGYPIVDAGMRELWQTGYMHNRVRMIAASFLIKHLLTDWRAGEAWFWDTLVDADAASNAASWQWVAGSGADAAPYFRIFNPILQGAKFDPDGSYVRRFVPELAGLPATLIHCPWESSPLTLAEAGIRLGETYPLPVVAHGMARQRALAAFASISG